MCGVGRVSLLLATHGAITQARLRDGFAALGYTTRQATALLRLAEGEGRMSQQSLGECMALDPSVLVGILNDLEAAELVERRRDPADRRRHIVALTCKGHQALADISTVVATVERELLADLAPDEIVALRALLCRVRTEWDDAACDEQS